MVRKSPVGVEILEGKALLSGVVPGLSGSLVATPTTTSAGTTVALTFTETNVSNHAITVTYGPGDDGFIASANGKNVWLSNAGPTPQYIELRTLEPGQSITVKATWNGHSNAGVAGGFGSEGPALHGTFTISNELDPELTATVTLGTSSPQIVPPKPPAHHVA
jgi:hypothetical protein